jgi:hypothetical protein
LTIVVLLILVAVWAVVLGPGLVRRRIERRSSDSIGAFHRQLRILQRTGPMLMEPAHRLGAPSSEVDEAPSAPISTIGVASHRRPEMMVVRPDARNISRPSSNVVPGARRPDSYFSPAACKRRREVLSVLSCSLVLSGLLGSVPTLRPLLMVTAFCGFVLVAYLGLLVVLRNRALEREAKLRYLPAQPQDHDVSVVVRRVAAR